MCYIEFFVPTCYTSNYFSLCERSVPLPVAATRKGPILLYPGNSKAEIVYKQVGTPVVLAAEEELKVLITITGLISPFYGVLFETAKW
jgi:hypothetical protein